MGAQLLQFKPVYGWVLIGLMISSFIGLFFSLQAGLLALFFLATAWWAWDRPEDSFLFFVIIAPLLPMLKITQTIGTASLIKDVIIITLFLRLVLWPLVKKTLPYRRNILLAPIVFTILWCSIAALKSDTLILGLLRWRDIILYIVLYFSVLHLMHDKTTQARRILIFAISFGIVLALGIGQWLFAFDSAVLRFDPSRSIWIPRLSSTLAHPSIFGEYVVAGACLFLPAAAFAGNRKNKIIFAAMFAVCLPFIFLTYSRAVWIGLAAAIAVMFCLFAARLAANKVSKKTLFQYFFSGVIFALLGLVVIGRFTPAGPFIRSIFDPTYASNEERLTFLIRLVAPTTTSQALIGRGLGDVIVQNFREVDLQVYDLASGSSRQVQLTKNATLVDNQYLKTFVELGVVGLVLFGWIYWRIGYHAVRSAIYSPEPIVPFWQIGFLAAFVIQALFIDIWDIFPTNAMFWVIAAIFSQQVLPLTVPESRPVRTHA